MEQKLLLHCCSSGWENIQGIEEHSLDSGEGRQRGWAPPLPGFLPERIAELAVPTELQEGPAELMHRWKFCSVLWELDRVCGWAEPESSVGTVQERVVSH